MSTKMMKILTFVATALLVISIGSTTVFGAISLTPNQMEGTDPQGNEIKNFGNQIIGILQTVGVVLSVVILVILGIKYMMGSAEEKADYKKTMIPYVVGAICIFLAPTIANMVFQLVQPQS